MERKDRVTVFFQKEQELLQAVRNFTTRYWYFMDSPDENLTITLFQADLLLVTPPQSDDQYFFLPKAAYDVPYFKLTNSFRQRFKKDLAGEAVFKVGREIPPAATQNLSQFVRDFPNQEAKITSLIFPITSGKKGVEESLIAKRFFNPFSGNLYTGQAMAELWIAQRKPLIAG